MNIGGTIAYDAGPRAVDVLNVLLEYGVRLTCLAFDLRLMIPGTRAAVCLALCIEMCAD